MDPVAVFLFFLVCGVIGSAIGSKNRAGFAGFWLGFILGPLGIFIVIFALDKRETCPHCGTRLNGRPAICPACKTRFEWSGKECAYFPPD